MKNHVTKGLHRGLIAPSILSADFDRLGEEIQALEKGQADWIHIDVMDGHFVPNLTIGPMVVEAIRPVTQLPLDCHLMVSRPEDWVRPFADAGADVITVHAEASPHLNRLIHQIREMGCGAGVSINPGTSLTAIEEVIDIVDMVLVMSVNPGFGGQKFIPSTIEKVKKLKEAREHRKYLIQVDGGVKLNNIAELRRAGADVFVAGSAVFSNKDRAHSIDRLRAGMVEN